MIRALLALLLLASLAAGCGKPATAPRGHPPSPALWVIEDARGEVAGWLFGTIHALPEGTRWETALLDAAIQNAGVLVVEVRDLDPGNTAAAFDALARDNPGPPLAERLPPERRHALTALLASKGGRAGSLDGLETWAAALALSRLAEAAPAGNGVDQALLTRFAGRKVAELEGAEAQLAIFDRLPETTQRALLTAVLAEQSDPAADEQALADAWLKGDLAKVERAVRHGLLADPVLYQALAADRNHAWARAIVPMLARGERPLVAVGTAHMLGPEGLPALLARHGYRVRRLQ